MKTNAYRCIPNIQPWRKIFWVTCPSGYLSYQILLFIQEAFEAYMGWEGDERWLWCICLVCVLFFFLMAAQVEVIQKRPFLFGNDELMFSLKSLIVVLGLDKMPE